MRLTVRDGLRVGLCRKGQKRWAELHGIDWAAFVRDGLDFESLEGIDDANLHRAMAVARAREEGSA